MNEFRCFCLLVSAVWLSPASAQFVDPELYASIVEGGSERLTLFLASGGSPSAAIRVPQSINSIPLLELAVRAGNEEATTLLLRSGAQPNDPVAFVEMAAEKGFTAVMNALLDEDPALVVRMRPENHPLVLALSYNHYDLAYAILGKMKVTPGRAEVEEVLNQALLIVVAKYRPDGPMRQFFVDLLDAGADPVSTNALAGAVGTCNPTLVAALLAEGADARRAYDLGAAPSHLAEYAMRCFEKAPDDVERILSDLSTAGADLCAVNMVDPRLPERAREYLRETADCN